VPGPIPCLGHPWPKANNQRLLIVWRAPIVCRSTGSPPLKPKKRRPVSSGVRGNVVDRSERPTHGPTALRLPSKAEQSQKFTTPSRFMSTSGAAITDRSSW
jgi:hypothetical protein